LDHANNYKTIIQAINEGFSSVIFDGSLLIYKENVARSREIVKVAHILDVTVEAEIGRVGRSEGEKNNFKSVLSIPKEIG
jgi:fructose-bisphosphate aldolase class II